MIPTVAYTLVNIFYCIFYAPAKSPPRGKTDLVIGLQARYAVIGPKNGLENGDIALDVDA